MRDVSGGYRPSERRDVRTDPLLALAEAWRADSAVLRRRGAPAVAEALDTCAAELEAAIDAQDAEELTIAEAAEESGYTEDHLRELVREGRVDGTNQDGRIHIRRSDLPRRPRAAKPRAPNPSDDKAVVADLAAELSRRAEGA